MIVYKFGGASVKDAAGIRNLADIVSREKDKLVVVVSALGKTTNSLEKILNSWIDGINICYSYLDDLYASHQSVVNELFPDSGLVSDKISTSFSGLREYLMSAKR